MHRRASGLRSFSSPIRIPRNKIILRGNHVCRNILILVLRDKRCVLIIIGKRIIIRNGHVNLNVSKSWVRIEIGRNRGHIIQIVIGIVRIAVVASVHFGLSIKLL